MTEKPDQINPVLLEIGKILKPHGLNGELIVDLSTNRTERINPGSVISTQKLELIVRTSKPHQKKFIVHFEGIQNREKADELRGEILFAESFPGGVTDIKFGNDAMYVVSPFYHGSIYKIYPKQLIPESSQINIPDTPILEIEETPEEFPYTGIILAIIGTIVVGIIIVIRKKRRYLKN